MEDSHRQDQQQFSVLQTDERGTKHFRTSVSSSNYIKNRPCHEEMGYRLVWLMNLSTYVHAQPLNSVRDWAICLKLYCVYKRQSLTRLCGCAVSSEALLFTFVISTLLIRASSNIFLKDAKSIVISPL